MPIPIQIVDGTKFASFDGLVLEVSGFNGMNDAMRIALNRLDRVGIESTSAGEFLFLVKTPTGGFSLVISAEKKSDWEKLATFVMKARSQLSSL